MAKTTKINRCPYKIVRTKNAGVFAGELKSFSVPNRHAIMTSARRLWYWDGAASLSQLAMQGVSKPKNCKFPTPVDRVELFEVVEVLDVTDAARASIEAVPKWEA